MINDFYVNFFWLKTTGFAKLRCLKTNTLTCTRNYQGYTWIIITICCLPSRQLLRVRRDSLEIVFFFFADVGGQTRQRRRREEEGIRQQFCCNCCAVAYACESVDHKSLRVRADHLCVCVCVWARKLSCRHTLNSQVCLTAICSAANVTRQCNLRLCFLRNIGKRQRTTTNVTTWCECHIFLAVKIV